MLLIMWEAFAFLYWQSHVQLFYFMNYQTEVNTFILSATIKPSGTYPSLHYVVTIFYSVVHLLWIIYLSWIDALFFCKCLYLQPYSVNTGTESETEKNPTLIAFQCTYWTVDYKGK